VTVLGFPCNQFAKQEPGTDAEILEFATSKFGVTFPMFHKIEVNGDGATPLYKWLKSEQPGDGDSAEITWNFEKFLIDKDGNVVERFAPTKTPEEVAEIIPKYL
jgi:glutathione peroxidase